MKKIIILLLIAVSFSFTTQEEKKVTISFTKDEIVVIYNALGELPAKQSEGLRARIVAEYLKVFPDTIKNK